MKVVRFRSQLRLRAAVRAGAALLGVLFGVVLLKFAGTHLGGSSVAALGVLLVAMLGGVAWHRLERDGLRERLAGLRVMPPEASPAEQHVDRAIFLVYAAAMLFFTLVIGFIAGDGIYAALIVLAGTLIFTFADLLAAREIELVEQANAAIVYTRQTLGAPKRAGREGPPLYALRAGGRSRR